MLSTIATLAKDFPPGLDYKVIYDPTIFIGKSVDQVIHTIFEAILLVVIVVFVFLQNWRASLIPVIAIPVSLIGTFAILARARGLLNNLSLFGLVLAVGIVVDDAIVVVENIERNLERGHVAIGSRAQDDGRGRRRLDRHCADLVRGVRARRPSCRASRASSSASSPSPSRPRRSSRASSR